MLAFEYALVRACVCAELWNINARSTWRVYPSKLIANRIWLRITMLSCFFVCSAYKVCIKYSELSASSSNCNDQRKVWKPNSHQHDVVFSLINPIRIHLIDLIKMHQHLCATEYMQRNSVFVFFLHFFSPFLLLPTVTSYLCVCVHLHHCRCTNVNVLGLQTENTKITIYHSNSSSILRLYCHSFTTAHRLHCIRWWRRRRHTALHSRCTLAGAVRQFELLLFLKFHNTKNEFILVENQVQ